MGSMSRKLRGKSRDLKARFATLRTKMREEKDLVKVENCFFEDLVPFGPFKMAAQAGSNKALETMIGVAAKSMGEQPDDLIMCLLHLPEHSFWHGPISTEAGLQGTVIYFEDERRAVCILAGRGTHSHRFRFSIPKELDGEGIDASSSRLIGISPHKSTSGETN